MISIYEALLILRIALTTASGARRERIEAAIAELEDAL